MEMRPPIFGAAGIGVSSRVPSPRTWRTFSSIWRDARDRAPAREASRAAARRISRRGREPPAPRRPHGALPPQSGWRKQRSKRTKERPRFLSQLGRHGSRHPRRCILGLGEIPLDHRQDLPRVFVVLPEHLRCREASARGLVLERFREHRTGGNSASRPRCARIVTPRGGELRTVRRIGTSRRVEAIDFATT